MFGKLFLLFIIVPLLELALFITLGTKIGLEKTILIIIVTAFIGAALAKSQGRLAMMKFQKTMAAGKMPHEEVLDGLMILIAGAVLLTPGFLTDAFGFALLLPPIRTALRARFAEGLKNKIQVVTPSGPTSGHSASETRRQPSALDNGEVIDV